MWLRVMGGGYTDPSLIAPREPTEMVIDQFSCPLPVRTLPSETTTGETAGTGYLWLGFAYHDPLPVMLVVIESLNRG